MKKVPALVITSLAYLTLASKALALQLNDPGIGIKSTTSPSQILTSSLTIIYVVATVLVLFFIIFGAFKWITSGGDKEAIAGARKTIINALIGLVLLALAVVIVVAVGKLLNINVFQNFKIPNLQGDQTDI